MKPISLFLAFVLMLPTTSPAFNRNQAIVISTATYIGGTIGAVSYFLYKKKKHPNKPINKASLVLWTLAGAASGALGGAGLAYIFTSSTRADQQNNLDSTEEALQRQHVLNMQQLELEHKQEEENKKHQEELERERKKNQERITQQQAVEEIKKREQEYKEKLAQQQEKMIKKDLMEAQKKPFDRQVHEKQKQRNKQHELYQQQMIELLARLDEAQAKAFQEKSALILNDPDFINKSKEEQAAIYKVAFNEIDKKYGLDNS
jgi:hypothetical protein